MEMLLVVIFAVFITLSITLVVACCMLSSKLSHLEEQEEMEEIYQRVVDKETGETDKVKM